MSIKPVDFQIAIPRTMEAAKAVNDEIQRGLSNQQQQAAMTQNKAEDSLKQVYSRSQAQDVRIAEKQKENRSGNRKGKKSGGKTDENEADDSGKMKRPYSNSTIDIKI